ncbi:class F sortase [Streptomyces sp. NPDC058739]|uniref:class F sortase n=1 Tax=Streptomyces sp. NPDC058739 TaxID=3346618 RepID=UPI00369C8C31
MIMKSSRRVLLVALAVAVAGLILSTAWLVRDASRQAVSGPADFGPVRAGADRQSLPTVPPAGASAGRPGRSPAVPAQVAQPRTLSLPRLGVTAPVDPVAVSDDGQVEVPDDPRRVGWYRFSPPPGSKQGSAVLVGHVDSDGRGLGVLVALNDVRSGDQVLVERADGSTVEYRVTARRAIDKSALAGSGAFQREGPAVLTLITCTGAYLPDAGGYQQNLVVTAVEART